MPRKGPAAKRQLVTDPVYGSPLVTALANKVLKEGTAQPRDHVLDHGRGRKIAVDSRRFEQSLDDHRFRFQFGVEDFYKLFIRIGARWHTRRWIRWL